MRAERRGEGWQGEEGEGRVKKNAPLKAEWKLTPAPKWLRVRPPPPPPPGHVLPSFLKGGQGISVGVVGPVAAPSQRSAQPGPRPLPLALRDGPGFRGISPPRHSRHPAPDAGIARSPHTAQPTPRTHPRYFFSCPTPPPAAHKSLGSSRGERRPPPPLGPGAPTGCGPESGAAARNLRPSWARGNNSACPCLPAAARPPSSPASGRGGARSGSHSPGRSWPGRVSGGPAGDSRAAGRSPGAGNGTGQLPSAG